MKCGFITEDIAGSKCMSSSSLEGKPQQNKWQISLYWAVTGYNSCHLQLLNFKCFLQNFVHYCVCVMFNCWAACLVDLCRLWTKATHTSASEFEWHIDFLAFSFINAASLMKQFILLIFVFHSLSDTIADLFYTIPTYLDLWNHSTSLGFFLLEMPSLQLWV